MFKRLFIHLSIFQAVFTPVRSLPTNAQIPLKSAVPCEEIGTFSTEWFLLNTLSEHRHDIHNKALFYTKGMSKQAQKLACQSNDYITIWDIWPKWLYEGKDSPDNRMRCIHRDRKVATIFYENMSRAFARMARKKATIMHSIDDYGQPPLDGIWGRIELPAIQKLTDIFEMEKINGDRSRSEQLTIDGKSARAIYEQAIKEVQNLFKRAKDLLSGTDGKTKAKRHGSCSIWNSQSNAFLDGLW